MKKLLLILSFICFCSCAIDDCVLITRKENTGANFLFFFQNGNGGITSNQTVLDEYGAIPSGSVTEEVYYQYEVGDTYCID